MDCLAPRVSTFCVACLLPEQTSLDDPKLCLSLSAFLSCDQSPNTPLALFSLFILVPLSSQTASNTPSSSGMSKKNEFANDKKEEPGTLPYLGGLASQNANQPNYPRHSPPSPRSSRAKVETMRVPGPACVASAVKYMGGELQLVASTGQLGA